MAATDVNADGAWILLVKDWQQFITGVIYLNDGTGNSAIEIPSNGEAQYAVYWGDFDHDGKIDRLVSARFGMMPWYVLY